MSRRTGGLYRINEKGEQELVHRSQPRGNDPGKSKTTAPKATEKPSSASKAQSTNKGDKAS